MHTSSQITHWNESEPVHATTASILYSIRKDDLSDGLLFDSVTMADVLDDTQAVNTLDALVVLYNQMDKKINQMKKAMNRAVTAVRVLQFAVSEPFKQRGITQVAAVFDLTDGQSVTVYFHNPDRTPNRLTPTDEMVSWKWLLNKKDITIVVAPEQGKELNPLIVGQRIMMLAEKNSQAFVRRNGDKAARLARVEAIKNEVGQLQAELTQAQQDLADIVSGKYNAPVVMPETGNTDADSEPVNASGVNHQELDIGAYSPNESLNKALQATGGNLIQSAKAVFKDALQGHYINTKIGKVLMMGASWRKLKQNLPTDTLKAKTIPFIPDILMGGVVTGSDLYKDRADGFIKFHQFEKDVELDDMTVTARLKVGEKADHQLVYHLNATEAAMDAVETKKPDEAGKSPLSGFLALDNAELENIIADDSDGINLIIVKVVKKEAPIVITGKELGDFPDTEEGKKAGINAVFDYYMNNFVEGMQDGIYSNALATNVRFDKIGAKKTKSFSGNPKKAKLVAALDKIIAQGEKTGQATATAKALASGVIMAHFLKHDVMLGEEKLTVRVVVHERKDGTFSYDHDIDREEYKAMGGSSGALDSVDSTENNLSVLQHNEPSLWHSLDGLILDNALDSVNVSNMVFNLLIEGEEPEYLDDNDDLELGASKLNTPAESIENAQPINNFDSRIEALRQAGLVEYERDIDALIADIKAAGMYQNYEAILLELDGTFDSAFYDFVSKKTKAH